MSFHLPDFSKVKGVAVITWELETATPLCIKSGSASLWNQASSKAGKPVKLRRINAEYDFFKKESLPDDASISDFYYGVTIDQDQLMLNHEIPASGVRGALRNYAIKRLTPKEHWNAALFPETEEMAAPLEEKTEYSKKLKAALKTPGWQMLRTIFGLAADTFDPQIEKESAKGRLSVETGMLEAMPKEIFQKNLFDGNFSHFEPGPINGRMLFTTRNPIDRITRAAKNGGLHSFTELAPGNRFSITLRFLNPVPTDLGMVALWEQGICQGLLRLGGLNSAGRGRLEIKSTRINLFLREQTGFSGLKVSTDESCPDILSGLYPEFIIPEWKTKTFYYLNLLQEAFTNFQGGKTNE